MKKALFRKSEAKMRPLVLVSVFDIAAVVVVSTEMLRHVLAYVLIDVLIDRSAYTQTDVVKDLMELFVAVNNRRFSYWHSVDEEYVFRSH